MNVFDIHELNYRTVTLKSGYLESANQVITPHAYQKTRHRHAPDPTYLYIQLDNIEVLSPTTKHHERGCKNTKTTKKKPLRKLHITIHFPPFPSRNPPPPSSAPSPPFTLLLLPFHPPNKPLFTGPPSTCTLSSTNAGPQL